jgi:hypothetical protein
MARHRAVRALGCASLLVGLLGAPAAHAAGDDAEQARALAQEGGDLLDAKRYAEALDRVTRAESLYHAPTHELMLGQAHEGLGHLATALAIYEKLAAEHVPPAAPRAFLDAQQTGKERLRALLARVPSILVVVRGLGQGDLPDVRIDGEPYSLEAGAAKPADPGSHVVVVDAPGHPPLERSVVLPDKGGVVTVEMQLGNPRAESPPAAGPETSRGQPVAADAAATKAREGSMVPALVAFGVGAVGLGVGGVTGILSLSNVSDLHARCPGDRCAPSQQSEIDSTKTLGVVSTVGFVVGGAGVAAGAALLLLRRAPTEASAAARRSPVVAPWIGAGAAGVEGSF